MNIKYLVKLVISLRWWTEPYLEMNVSFFPHPIITCMLFNAQCTAIFIILKTSNDVRVSYNLTLYLESERKEVMHFCLHFNWVLRFVAPIYSKWVRHTRAKHKICKYLAFLVASAWLSSIWWDWSPSSTPTRTMLIMVFIFTCCISLTRTEIFPDIRINVSAYIFLVILFRTSYQI